MVVRSRARTNVRLSMELTKVMRRCTKVARSSELINFFPTAIWKILDKAYDHDAEFYGVNDTINVAF